MESWYDKTEDVLNIELDDGKDYWKSIELADGIVLDIAKDGHVVAIEILGASTIFSGDVKKVLKWAKPLSEKVASGSS